MVNIFDTDKCIFICYPRGAGGKFLINCLALTNYFYLQIPFYTYNKLRKNPKFLEQYPIDKLKKFLSSKDKKWNDLDMGDIQFFGISNQFEGNINKKFHNLEFYKESLEQNPYFYLNEKKYFFRTIHSMDEFVYYSSIWKNPTVIKFINCKNWILSRRQNKLENWDILDNINITDFSVCFDVNSFFYEDDFLNELQKILDCFNLTLKNIDKIKEFYKLYNSYIVNK